MFRNYLVTGCQENSSWNHELETCGRGLGWMGMLLGVQ
jgi:hypothetical protein